MQTKLKHLIFGPLSRFGISHKIQATALWSMLESFSSPLFSILLIPIFTHNLGLENYGIYVMVMAFVSLFGFTGLGMSTSITYYLAVSYGASDPQHIAERLGSALVLTLFGTVMFSCLFLLILKLFTSPLSIYYPQLIDQKKLVYAALFMIVITQLDMVVSASLKGLQQFETSSKVEFLLRLLSFIVLALVAITQKNVFSIILFTLILAVFNLSIRYITLNKKVHFHYCDIKINKQSGSELFHFGKWMTLQNISGAIFNSLDKLLLGFYFNSTAVGIFNIIISVTQLPHFVLASSFSFLMPKITARAVNKDVLKQYYYKSLIASALFAFFMTLILAVLYPYFANHFKLVNIKLEYYAMLFGYGILALSVSAYNFILGIGEVKLLSCVNTFSALVGIVAAAFLISKYEILGAVSARLAYTMIVMITLFIIPVKFKNKSKAR